jgi:hypothetical protein
MKYISVSNILSIGYGNICFEFNDSFTTASNSRVVNILVLQPMSLLFRTLITPNIFKHKFFVFKLNTTCQLLNPDFVFILNKFFLERGTKMSEKSSKNYVF